MAVPIHFASANAVLGPPRGAEDEVVQLPVLRIEGRLISCWALSAAELEEILRTGVVWLSVWGRLTQPPVLVTGCQGEAI